jgi:hypothetical protein
MHRKLSQNMSIYLNEDVACCFKVAGIRMKRMRKAANSIKRAKYKRTISISEVANVNSTINVSHHFDLACVGDVHPVQQLNNDAKTTECCLFLNKELKCTVSLSSGFRLSYRKAFKRERNLHSEAISVGGIGGGAAFVTENTHLAFTVVNRLRSGTWNGEDLPSH